ncbi:olfactory receptor 13G1-like [Acanthochromis polyacanthus]|uniref:olfactory receptor 13G1-like n=1 Tax=Acanthochromis polyacanthus TaxID=80966 RepID=UPI002233E729|nr:olfactory receptor 13G1-like [Acanthochromis polyacanthus]
MSLLNASVTITQFSIGGFDTVTKPVLVGVVILITYFVIIVANMMNILLFFCDKKLHKPMYLLICNLAVVDIVYTTSVSPTMIGVLLAGAKTISFVPCIIQMMVHHVGAVMETFALAVMAFDRLIAVSCPFQYQSYLTNTRIVILTCFLWLVALVCVSVMPVTVLSLTHCRPRLIYVFCDYAGVLRTTCGDLNHHFNVITVLSFFLLFFTFTLICLSYFVIVFYVKLSSNVDKKKMGSTCLSHLIVVVCYYCPLFIRIVLTRMGVVLTAEERHGLQIGAILGSSLVNPFVYCLNTKEIKCKIFKVFNIVASSQ